MTSADSPQRHLGEERTGTLSALPNAALPKRIAGATDRSLAGRWRPVAAWLRLAGFGFGLLVAVVGQHFCNRKQGREALTYYGVAALLTAFSLVGSEPVLRLRQNAPSAMKGEGPQHSVAWRLMRHVLPIVVLVAAAYPSLYWRNLEVPPGPMHDEARSALDALSYYNGSISSAAWRIGDAGAPAIHGALNGYLFRWFGPTLDTFRCTNATLTLLAAIIMYYYVRRFGGVMIGLVTAVLFVQCLWVAHLSRWGFSMPWGMLGTTLALSGFGVAFARAAEATAPSPLSPSRWLPYALAGFGMIFAQYGYLSARLVIPAALATLVIAYASQPRYLRENWPGLLVLVAVFAVFAMPWYWVLSAYPELMLGRANSLGIHNDMLREGSFQPLWLNLAAHLKLFNYAGDLAPVNNLPGQPAIHYLVAPVVAMGLCVSLYHWRALTPMLPALWFGILIWSGILSRWTEVPKTHRFLTVAPVLFTAVGTWLAQGRLFLETAMQRCPHRVRVGLYGTGVVALISWACAHAYFEYDLYFVQYASSRDLYYHFSPGENLLDAALRAKGPAIPALIDSFYGSQQMRFYTHSYDWVKFVPADPESFRQALPAAGPVQVYLSPRLSDFLGNLATELGTHAEIVRDPRSTDQWWVAAVLPDAALARWVLSDHPEMFRPNAGPPQP